ncbi:MAG: pyruvate kinase [Acidobacteriota bacterium]|nr:pyruvate kinase [Acidobacteriota bacterium]
MKSENRLTRIVATLGPASSDERVVGRLARAGMNVARLNMSHGDAAFHARTTRLVRKVSRRTGQPIGIMADLQGPKVRLGSFDEPLAISRGMKIVLTTRAAEADPERGIVPVDYRHLPVEAERGHEILVADGTVRLEVVGVGRHRVTCRVAEGRQLPPRAGFHLPQARVRRSALTAKDRRDLAAAIDLEVDFVALSFVRRASDLVEARKLIDRLGGGQMLIAKIETIQAVNQLEEILDAAEGVMVARGDLGVALPPERVPVEQKRIIEAAGKSGKPVITATQMLESMRTSSRPTRAEASDVANAVWDGSWAVMLSAETATGEFPVESVKMMDRIAREAEKVLLKAPRRRSVHVALTPSEAIADAAAWIAFDVGAEALVALTRSGASARQVARFLPALPTFAYTPSRETLTRMTLFRGIIPRLLGEQRSLRRAIGTINEDLRRRRDLVKGDLVVIIGGSPDEPLGVTNRLVIHQVR